MAKNILKFIRIFIVIILISVITAQFTEVLGYFTGILAVVGGTIVGFAAMNTLGNLIAGLIIMVSKPFIVGDRILYEEKIADVVSINLIYTVIVDLDSLRIHIPNQRLLQEEITNLGKDNIIRRGIRVTPGFEEDRHKVERVLIEAAEEVPEVLNYPEPYVWINSFQNYAVEYILYVFIRDIKNLPEIESELHKKVFDLCKANNIDISTPLLHQEREEDKRG
ncbi:MAG: mechanosensitive ion channel [Promethearchaeia archaeon]